MVNVNHFSSDDDLACVEDNNDPPGVYRWMPAKEYLARCMSGGQGWVFAFTRLPVVVQVPALIETHARARRGHCLLLASSTLGELPDHEPEYLGRFEGVEPGPAILAVVAIVGILGLIAFVFLVGFLVVLARILRFALSDSPAPEHPEPQAEPLP
jgi:hypothetical protein